MALGAYRLVKKNIAINRILCYDLRHQYHNDQSIRLPLMSIASYF